MESIELLRDNLVKSRDRVLLKVEDMREHCFVSPTPNGGAHTIWVLGHLAFIEGDVIHNFMLGKDNPMKHWQNPFDTDDFSLDKSLYPPFDEVLAKCREMRDTTLTLLDSLTEADLDQPAAKCPKNWEETFGTYRRCLQFMADHWYMHRGQLADARRASQLERMWV